MALGFTKRSRKAAAAKPPTMAQSLERLVQLAETWLAQQGLKVPQRRLEPEEPESGAVSFYDPVAEARLEQAATDILVAGRAGSFDEAYELARQEANQR